MSKLADYIRRTARPSCAAVVLAAGESRRMGFDKLFAPVGGVPVLARALIALEESDAIDEILVVTQSEKIVAVAELCETYGIHKARKILCGGATRAESALAGVSEADPDVDLIAVHDGARPFVTGEIIRAAVHAAALYAAAAPALAVKDTVKLAAGDVVNDTPPRETVRAVQTPQVFKAELIKAALTNALTQALPVTDDCAAAEAIGVRPHLVPGDERNLKITTPLDLVIAEAIVRAEEAEQ